ncbi:MAG: hypothetical protein AMXMBFR7_51270 [Planctomycetota bacterium]
MMEPFLDTNPNRDAYYKRVAPLYGPAFDKKVLGVCGGDSAMEAALLLARCGVRNFAIGPGAEALPDRLRAQIPWEDRWIFEMFEKARIVVADAEAPEGFRSPAPVLRLTILPATRAVRARIDAIPVNEPWPKTERGQNEGTTSPEAINRLAALARAELLRGSPHEPAEARLLLNSPRSSVLFGHARWPWWIRSFEREAADVWIKAQPVFKSWKPLSRRGRVLVVGCGSLGSIAAETLAPHVEAMTLSDPERVDLENLVRQAYDPNEVGRWKAEALAERLARYGAHTQALMRAEEDSPDGVRKFGNLLDLLRPDLVILTTGTGAEYAMAEALRKRGIRHVAARCYARARFFELILVDGAIGPCFHCLREQVHTGPAPSLTPEQHARYDPAWRPGELNAEPATVLDSGYCALALARAGLELLKPPSERASWLSETLAQERTCWLGANHAERDVRGHWAYGIDCPGKLVTFGVEDIVGAAPGERCSVCGREWLPEKQSNSGKELAADA